MTAAKYRKRNQREDNKSRKHDEDVIIHHFHKNVLGKTLENPLLFKTLAKTELMLEEKCFEELAMTINTNFYYTVLLHVVLTVTSVNRTYCYKILLCASGHRPAILMCTPVTSKFYYSNVKYMQMILLAMRLNKPQKACYSKYCIPYKAVCNFTTKIKSSTCQAPGFNSDLRIFPWKLFK